MPTVLMAFVDSETVCLRGYGGVIIITARVKKLAFLSLRKKFSEAIKKRAGRTTKTLQTGKVLQRH